MFDPLTERELEILTLVAEGLSNHEIARQLSLTHGTVKWYTGQIYSKLGVNNRTQAVARLDTLRSPESPLPSAHATHHLPMPLTAFIGRQREIADIKPRLATHRLVTLTGPGGSGKTRLALEIAASIHHAFANGAVFVDLAPVSSPSLVAGAIAHALGIAEYPDVPLVDSLKRALHTQERLLIIDNFEHVIEAAILLSDLLVAAPHLTCLVTSREALRLNGEQEYPVPPLSLPEHDPAPSHRLAESEATALFLQRAQLAQPRFEVTPDNAPAIAEICLRLDGLPLAIELAAARCKLLSPQELLARLDSRLTTLTTGPRDLPARQQTLRRTIDWSYNLLEDSEQRLFARLAVFRGGRSLEAIEAVCAEGLPEDVFEPLTGLLGKNLIYRKDSLNGEARFWMLETIHEYAWARLEANEEVEMLRQLHAEYFVQLAERAEPELRLANHLYWSQLLEVEINNFREIFEWSLISDHSVTGLRLAAALFHFWWAYGYHKEGQHWTQQFLDHVEETTAINQAKFLFSAGCMALFADNGTANALLTRALRLARSLDDMALTGWILIFLSYSMLDEAQKALAIADEGLEMLRVLDHKPGIAQALNIIGEIARFSGDDNRAQRAYEECLAIAQQTGETRRTQLTYLNLALLAQHKAEHMQGIALARRGLQLALEMNNTLEMGRSLTIIAGSVAAQGQPEHAARLLGVSETEFGSMGAFHLPSDKLEIDRIIRSVRDRLDEEAFNAALAEGRKMTLEQAVAEALGENE